MKRRYEYDVGTRRAFRWPGHADIKTHRAPNGWKVVEVSSGDTHPLTGKTVKEYAWWIVEEKT